MPEVEARRYKQNQEEVLVKCPCCHEAMAGWSYMREWAKYWINHRNPLGKKCWATEDQMKRVKKQWDEKYEILKIETVE